LKREYKIDGRIEKPTTVTVEQLKLCVSTKKKKRKQARKQHRLVDKDIEHLELSNSEGGRTEREDTRMQNSKLAS
jgi:hypothetical protein